LTSELKSGAVVHAVIGHQSMNEGEGPSNMERVSGLTSCEGSGYASNRTTGDAERPRFLLAPFRDDGRRVMRVKKLK